jgi:hypothetical protein
MARLRAFWIYHHTLSHRGTARLKASQHQFQWSCLRSQTQRLLKNQQAQRNLDAALTNARITTVTYTSTDDNKLSYVPESVACLTKTLQSALIALGSIIRGKPFVLVRDRCNMQSMACKPSLLQMPCMHACSRNSSIITITTITTTHTALILYGCSTT